MADASISLLQSQIPKPSYLHLFDEKSITIRGPRYNEYAKLREKNLLTRTLLRNPVSESYSSPPMKNSSFHGTPPSGKKGSILVSSRMKTQFVEPKSEPRNQVKVHGTPPSGRKEFSVLAKRGKFRELEVETNFTPLRRLGKVVQTPESRKKGYSALAQSVPDFSSVVRKENRRPVVKNPENLKGVKTSGVMTRKSYATMEGLKGFSGLRESRDFRK